MKSGQGLQTGYEIRCVHCRRPGPDELGARCGACGSMLDPDYPGARLHDATSWLERYASVLPMGEGYDGTTPAEPTPLLRAPASGTGGLVLKDESANPTHSTKYRMAVVAVEHMRSLGVGSFVFSSTGNSASAFAHVLVRHPDMHARYYWPCRCPLPRELVGNPQVEIVPVEDDGYAGAQRAARGDYSGGVSEGGFFNIGRREGLKVAYLEAFEQLGRLPSVIIQAISSGMGLWAARRAVTEFTRFWGDGTVPRLVGVQQASCAPMVHAWDEGSPEILPRHVVHDPQGIARAILLGDPTGSYPFVRQVVTETGGTFVAVPDDAVLRAQHRLRNLVGIAACESSATAMSAVDRLVATGTVGSSDEVLVMITGGERSAAALATTSAEVPR